MIATTLAINSPYPERNVVKTEAEERIFQGQMAKAKNSTMYCPRGIVMYRGRSMLLSDPNGIILAAILVPRIETIQQKANKKTANLVLPDQYLSRIASSKSHGFQRARPQELLIAAVARIPRDADTVTAMGLVMS
jgi:hypothetical protein